VTRSEFFRTTLGWTLGIIGLTMAVDVKPLFWMKWRTTQTIGGKYEFYGPVAVSEDGVDWTPVP